MENKVSRDADSMEQHIANLAALLEQHGLTHLEYETDEGRVVLGKEPSPLIQMQGSTAPAAPITATDSAFNQVASAASVAMKPAPATQDASDVDLTEGDLITAPLVGIAYSAKEPGAAPFVSVGDKVQAGTVLCLIEAMKMFNEVKAPTGGIITKVHFEDASLVEYGAPLFTLDSPSN